MNKKIILVGVAMAFLMGGCGQDKSQPAAGSSEKTGQAASQEAGSQAAAQPQALGEPQNIPSWSFSGKVAEVVDAAGYTYVRVENGSEQKWVAIPSTKIEIGEEVAFADGLVMPNFHSKALNKDFEEVVFCSGIVGREPAPAPAMPPAMAAPGETAQPPAGDSNTFAQALQAEDGVPGGAPAGPGSAKAVVPFEAIKVEKATAENGVTVNELFEKTADLNGKPVAVRGQVVKVSKNIMGKNWVHLQDGTGDPSKNTHDLVVTTAATPAMGDIVTVAGKVEANKDFGSGYKYDVILEDVEIAK